MQELIFLKEAYIQPRSGNRYPRGEYPRNALPKEIRYDKKYVTELPGAVVKTEDDNEISLNQKEPPVAKLNKKTYEILENTKLNLNSASKTELMDLPSIGIKKAETIISNRPYKDLDELKEKTGLSIDLKELDAVIEPVQDPTLVTGAKMKTYKKESVYAQNRKREQKKEEIISEFKKNVLTEEEK